MMLKSRTWPAGSSAAIGTSVTPAARQPIPVTVARRRPKRLPSAPAGSDDSAKASAVLPFTRPMKSVPYPRRSRYRFSNTATKPK